MKILHIIPTYKPAYVYGGPIFSVSLICENLAREGHDVLMLTTTANGAFELDVPVGKKVDVDGVPTIYYKRYTKDHTHLAPGLMWHVLTRCRQYDAVHIHSWWNIPVIVSVLFCWLRGVKPILSPRGMLSGFTFEKEHSSAKMLFHKTAGRFLLKRTRLHLTADSEQKEVEHIGADTFVLPNYIQLASADVIQKKTEDSRPLTLLFLSRLHPKKNIEGLLRALGGLTFDVKLKIAGMGEDEYVDSLKQFAEQQGVADRIEWLGEIHDREKFGAYASADLFVLPSYNENFANVVIEALSAGTPVMVSAHVGLAGYVSENDLGWICGIEPESISGTLEEIYRNRERLKDIRQRAVATVQRDFSPRVLTKKYIQAYGGA